MVDLIIAHWMRRALPLPSGNVQTQLTRIRNMIFKYDMRICDVFEMTEPTCRLFPPTTNSVFKCDAMMIFFSPSYISQRYQNGVMCCIHKVPHKSKNITSPPHDMYAYRNDEGGTHSYQKNEYNQSCT